MASPGWYPDPSGQPNRFRFWDGQSWSQETTADPYTTPPPPSAQPPQQQPPQQQPPQAQPPQQQGGQPGQPGEQPWGQQPGQPGQPQPEQPQPGQPQPGQPGQPQPGQPGQPPAGWPQGGQGYAAAGQSGGQLGGPYAGDPGQGWSPTPPGGPDGRGGSGKKKTILVIVAVVVVIALIIGGIFAAMAITGDDDDDTASGEESSQSADPSESGESESSGDSEGESQSPSESESGDSEESESTDPSADRPTPGPECRSGNPMKGKSKDTKNRAVGGGLSFAKPNGFKNQDMRRAFTFATDVSTMIRRIGDIWVAPLMVGRIKASEFGTPEEAAQSVMNCMAGSDNFYSGFEEMEELESEATTVGKKKGWRLRSEIRVDHPQVDAEGDVVEVVVVKVSKKHYGLFIGGVPIGDKALLKKLDQTAGSLRVQ